MIFDQCQIVSSIKLFWFLSVCLERGQSSAHNMGLKNICWGEKKRLKLLKMKLIYLEKFQCRLDMYDECL